MRYLVFSLLVVTSALSGCSLYYESQAKDMVQRQMDAMVFVEGGEFMMGNPGGWSVRSDTIPAHRVIVDDFYIQKYEVSQEDFELFMAVTGYEPSDSRYKDMKDEMPERFDNVLPAVTSWVDSNAFCLWLGKHTGKEVRLPTEAEWEYAARAQGQMLPYATENGEAIENVSMAAKTESSRYSVPSEKASLPNPPGVFPPNALGLYDMSSNVGEWVGDKYSDDYYQRSPIDNPKGPALGQIDIFEGLSYRVLRGGHYEEFEGNTTVTRRKGSERLAAKSRGFRCSWVGSVSSKSRHP